MYNLGIEFNDSNNNIAIDTLLDNYIQFYKDSRAVYSVDNEHYKIYEGNKYNKMLALKYVAKYKNEPIFLFLCDCGKFKITRFNPIKFGKVKSCGCEFIKIKETMKDRSTTHGMTKTPLYKVWLRIKERCYNINSKDYYLYGGRGIILCDEWKNSENGFMNFYHWATEVADPPYEKGLSIDRIDVNGNYCPENCRWATDKLQALNRRTNTIIPYKNWNFSVSIWSEITGIADSTLSLRYFGLKWSAEDTLLVPPHRHKGEHWLKWEVDPKYEIYNKIV